LIAPNDFLAISAELELTCLGPLPDQAAPELANAELVRLGPEGLLAGADAGVAEAAFRASFGVSVITCGRRNHRLISRDGFFENLG